MEYTYDQVATALDVYLGGTPGATIDLTHIKGGYMTVMAGLDPRTRPLRSHQWSFLRPLASLTFWAEATGTMTISGTGNTTVTDSTNSPFFNSMIGATITADTSETTYTISAYTSASVVTVTADASADTGDTFTITPDGIYDPPSGFAGLIEMPVYAYDATYPNTCEIEEATPETIYRMWRGSSATGYTYRVALIPASFTSTVGQKWKFIVAPVPSYTFATKLRMVQDISDPATGDYFLGGHITSQAIMDAALAHAERVTRGTVGIMAEAAKESMCSAIDADKQLARSNEAVQMVT